jgi:hypothetical protein
MSLRLSRSKLLDSVQGHDLLSHIADCMSTTLVGSRDIVFLSSGQPPWIEHQV